MSGENLIVESLIYNLSTRSSSCNILNDDKNFKSLCEFNIPNLIPRDELIEYVHFSIPDCVIPVSFYGINDYNNQLDILINGVVRSFKFPFGNYNANLLIAEFLLLTSGLYFNMTLNLFNSVFTITNSSTSFSILGSSSIDYILGFNGDAPSSSSYPYSVTAPRPCNFLPLPRVCLRCAEIAHNTVVGVESKTNIIMAIPNNARPNSQIYFVNSSRAKIIFKNYELTRFVLEITDDDGQLINFNGISSFFTFQFDIHRRYIPKPPSFRAILKHVDNKRFLDDEAEEFENQDV